jgi:hypothetical protein
MVVAVLVAALKPRLIRRLVCLYAAEDSKKFDAAAVRFLGRLIAERCGTTLGSVQLAAAALAELRGWRREAAVKTLLWLL